MENNKNAVIYSLSASDYIAQEVAQILNKKVSPSKVLHFADGEILCEPLESVREKDVFLIQSTCNPVTENLMEILIFVDAIKRASAKTINVVMPYFGYARQDRKSKPREPITSRLVADLLKTAGVDRVITIDLHAAQIQGFFSCLVDELTAIPLLAQHFKGKLNPEDSVVVSPDHGGVNRARKVAERLNLPLAIIDKRRTGPNVAQVMNIIGDVKGKNCLMIDDIIDTAGSVHAGANALLSNGAKTVRVACSHGVFSGPAADRLLDGTFEEIVVTNSIPLPEKMKDPRVSVISLGQMIARVIEKIESGDPVSTVYEMFNL